MNGNAIKSTTGITSLPGRINAIATIIGINRSPEVNVAGSPNPTASLIPKNHSRFEPFSLFIVDFLAESVIGIKACENIPATLGKIAITALVAIPVVKIVPQELSEFNE